MSDRPYLRIPQRPDLPRPVSCPLCRDYGYIEVPDFSSGAPSTQVEPCPDCSEVDGLRASCGCGLMTLLALGLLLWSLL